ncbi:MAG: rRNA maturation RNase YbeY [Candidatus Goldbacteria bacterium]|nr:rRNA maturation RNase YbeY [Candidatus Goldiibacteriota bacterium]
MKKVDNKEDISIFFDKKIKLKYDIKKIIKKILLLEKKNNYRINLIFTDDKKIKQINTDFRLKKSETDVISFYYKEHKFCGGDIFISVDTAKRNSKEHGVDFQHEIIRLVIHGVLHALGYNHTDDFKSNEIMKKKQELYVKKFLKEN